MGQAQLVGPCSHSAQIIAGRSFPKPCPAQRLKHVAKALRVDLVGWWWVLPVLSIFGLPLGAGRRPSRRLACVCVLAGVRATTTLSLIHISEPTRPY